MNRSQKCWCVPKATGWHVAIYHLHVKNISRRDGRSAVAAAAYRAGETLPNEAEEGESAFGGRRDVLFTAIRIPDAAPAWMADRATLWNGVERAEKRRDARLAKEIEFALPRELPQAEWRAVALAMADVYLARGHVVDLAIHSDARHENPHVHLMLTTRRITGTGFGGKLREADGLAFVTEARAVWASIANAALGKIGAGIEIDPRSHVARGIVEPPTTHRGPDRAERLARRRQERGGTMSMSNRQDHNMAEELSSLPGMRDLFPMLARRPDWPPTTRSAPETLDAAGRIEFAAFWRAVDETLARDRAAVARGPDARPDPLPAPVSQDVLRDWERLERAVNARMAANGLDPGKPTSWSEVQTELTEFREQLVRIRALEAENAVLRARWEQWSREAERNLPVPGPDRDPVPPAEQARAEDAMLAAMEGPGAPSRTPVGPEQVRAAAVAAARQDVPGWWQNAPGREPVPREVEGREDEPDRWWR